MDMKVQLNDASFYQMTNVRSKASDTAQLHQQNKTDQLSDKATKERRDSTKVDFGFRDLVDRLIKGDKGAELSDVLASDEKNFLDDLLRGTYTREGLLVTTKDKGNLSANAAVTKRIDVKV